MRNKALGLNDMTAMIWMTMVSSRNGGTTGKGVIGSLQKLGLSSDDTFLYVALKLWKMT